MVAAYGSKDVTAVVTWNPLLSEIVAMPNSYLVSDSSSIPGEIIDLMVVNTKTLLENPNFGKALTGAWYEVMSTMTMQTADATKALQHMAKASGTDLAGYKAQLATTKMFYNAAEAVAFTNDKALTDTMQAVAEFSFDHGLLGEGAADAGFIGVETPAGIYGDKKNIKFRFDPTYMALAAGNKL
jgi:NitT/TauT family transport system substrate-binding protein